MSIEEPIGCAFPSTHWSRIALAAEGDGANDTLGRAKDALGEVLARYMPALRAYLVRERRLDGHAADDLLQGFVTDRVLEANLLARADRHRGRFRTFLLACLNHYSAEQHRRGRTRARGGGAEVLAWSDELPHPADCEPCGAEAFELLWARHVLARAVDRMRAECERAARPDLWTLFEGRVLRPALAGAAPLGYAEVVGRFGFDSVAAATNALVTAKRVFARLLREAVAEYVPSDEVEDELRRLKLTLAGGASGGTMRPRPGD